MEIRALGSKSSACGTCSGPFQAQSPLGGRSRREAGRPPTLTGSASLVRICSTSGKVCSWPLKPAPAHRPTASLPATSYWQLTASSHREAGSVVEPIIRISKLRLRERKLLAQSPARNGGIRHRTWVPRTPRPRAGGRACFSMAASSNPSAVGGTEERRCGLARWCPTPSHTRC